MKTRIICTAFVAVALFVGGCESSVVHQEKHELAKPAIAVTKAEHLRAIKELCDICALYQARGLTKTERGWPKTRAALEQAIAKAALPVKEGQ
jgi:hypothetical protein